MTAIIDQKFDFLAICQPGMIFRTRGRSEARILKVDVEGRLIHGEIPMYGPVVWARDGVYRDSPGRAAGPFDLMPLGEGTGSAPKKSVRLDDAVDAEGRAFCCD